MKKYLWLIALCAMVGAVCADEIYNPAPDPAITELDGTADRLLWVNSSGDVAEFALGTAADVLTSAGASSVPTWETPSAGGGGDAYLASNQTFTGFNTFDDGSYQVDLLQGTKAAYFDDVSLTHWVHIVDGTYGIKAEVGGASSLIAGQYTDGTRVVNLGDNANGYAVNVTAGASYFDGMVDLNTDALAGTDAVSWSVLTNQIALLAPAGGGSQTPWTNNVDAAGFALTALDYTSMNTNAAAVTGVAGKLVQYVLNDRLYSVYNSVTNYSVLN